MQVVMAPEMQPYKHYKSKKEREKKIEEEKKKKRKKKKEEKEEEDDKDQTKPKQHKTLQKRLDSLNSIG